MVNGNLLKFLKLSKFTFTSIKYYYQRKREIGAKFWMVNILKIKQKTKTKKSLYLDKCLILDKGRNKGMLLFLWSYGDCAILGLIH